jgi:hypothetical protein
MELKSFFSFVGEQMISELLHWLETVTMIVLFVLFVVGILQSL